jgi:hypothetical protein
MSNWKQEELVASPVLNSLQRKALEKGIVW